MLHAIDLRENAQRLTLLACCELILGRLDDALSHALRAHTLAPARVQTLCVLVDVLYTMGRGDQARRMLYIACLLYTSPHSPVLHSSAQVPAQALRLSRIAPASCRTI